MILDYVPLRVHSSLPHSLTEFLRQSVKTISYLDEDTYDGIGDQSINQPFLAQLDQVDPN
jgi:hypothetical protein